MDDNQIYSLLLTLRAIQQELRALTVVGMYAGTLSEGIASEGLLIVREAQKEADELVGRAAEQFGRSWQRPERNG